MKLAAVITVRNERDLLRWNILYHQAIGIDEFYIFLDQTTDGTEDTLRDLPGVHVSVTTAAESFMEEPHLSRFATKAATVVTARQNLNTWVAMEKARASGAAWLVALDADELVCPHLHEAVPGQLQTLFSSIPHGVDTVCFPSLEVLQNQVSYGNVFAEETLFKRNTLRIRQRVHNPYTHRTHTVRGLLGHVRGKAAVRLSADAVPATVHGFAHRAGTPLMRQTCGFLLHYYMYSFQDFIKKFRNFHDHPEVLLYGYKMPYIPKLLFRDLVNDATLSLAELQEYFEKWVLFKPADIARMRCRKLLGCIPLPPAIVEVTAARDVFRSLESRLPLKSPA